MLRAIDDLELDVPAIDHDLSFILEVNGDTVADSRLDLPDAPIGALGVAHEHAWLEKGVHWDSPVTGGDARRRHGFGADRHRRAAWLAHLSRSDKPDRRDRQRSGTHRAER